MGFGKKVSKADSGSEVTVIRFDRKRITFRIMGETPFLFNRMGAKGIEAVFIPGAKMNRAEKASRLKHDPVAEFIDTFDSRDDGPTRLVIPSTMIKGAIRSAAVDTEGTSKSEVGRLVYVVGDWISIYGVPKMHISVVRSADQARTPDVRTRAVLPKWGAEFEVEFVSPRMNAKGIIALLFNAGITIGIGDYRPEKGRGQYGQFKIDAVDIDGESCCDPDFDKEWKALVKAGSRDAQDRGINMAEPYDDNSRAMYDMFMSNIRKTGRENMLKFPPKKK